MSILFDDASLQYALATNPAIAFPFATGCWIYLDDIDIDQTFAAFQDASSEDNYHRLGLYGRKREVTSVTTGANAFPEVTDFTTVADVAGSLENKYFTLSSPTTDYYVWFSIDSSSVDPAPGGLTAIQVGIALNDTANAVAIALQIVLDAHIDFGASVITNVVTVTNAAVGSVVDAVDVNTTFTVLVTTQGAAGVLENGYFTLSSPTTDYYVWFSIDSGSVDPAPGGLTAIQVGIAADDTANAVAIALQIALDAHIDFGASVITNVVTVTNAVFGITTDAADFNTGFTISVTVQGTDTAVFRGEIVDNVSVSEIADSGGAVLLNTWHHVLAIFNTATDIRVYLDGANEGLSPGGSAVAPTGVDTLSIGRSSKLTPDEYMSGRIAELTTWNLSTVFNAAEIASLGVDEFSSLLVRTDELLYFAPIYNNDDPIIDIMLHQNATLFNAPTTADHPPVQQFEPETFQRFRSGPIEFILGEDGTPPFSDLLFTHNAAWELDKAVSNSIEFQQQVQHNVIVINVATNINFSQTVGKTATINVSVTTNVNFSQNMGPTTEESLSSDIAFTSEASRGDHLISNILFDQSVVAEASKGTENDILFNHAVAVELDINPVAQNDILFGQAVVAYIDVPCDRHEYSPFGAGMPVITIGVASNITLVCSASSITLRNPDFGNSESVDVDRALNISRGGTPRLVRDSQWPKQTTHSIGISVMTRAKAQELLDFLKDCLGLLVTYTDHEARIWEGIIINPDSAVSDEGDCKYSAKLNIQSTLVP